MTTVKTAKTTQALKDTGPEAKKQLQKLQRAIVDGLEDVKAQDIQVFDTEHITSLFERVIVASGTSNRQTKALAASVRDAVRDAGFVKPRMEGEDNGEWIIVDCGAVVAHIMQPTIRQYYHLEELWGEKPVKTKLGASTPTPQTSRSTALVRAKTQAQEEALQSSGRTAARTAARNAAKKKAAGSSAASGSAPRKKAAAQKLAAKKVAGKKVADRKVAVKKVAVKNVTIKTPAAKVAVQKLVVKPAAKKTAAKSLATAKKAAPKKVAAKKTRRSA